MSCFRLIDNLHHQLQRRVVNQSNLRNSQIVGDLELFGIDCQNMVDARLQWVDLMNQILLAITPFHFMLRQHRARFPRLYRDFEEDHQLEEDLEMFQNENIQHQDWVINRRIPVREQRHYEIRTLEANPSTRVVPSDVPQAMPRVVASDVPSTVSVTQFNTVLNEIKEEIEETVPEDASTAQRVQATLQALMGQGGNRLTQVMQSAVQDPRYTNMVQNMLPGIMQGLNTLSSSGQLEQLSRMFENMSHIQAPPATPDVPAPDVPNQVETGHAEDVVIEDANDDDDDDDDQFNRILNDTLRTFHSQPEDDHDADPV